MLIGAVILLFAIAGWSGMAMAEYFSSSPMMRKDRFILCVIWGPLFLSPASLFLADTGCFSMRNLWLCVMAWFGAGALGFIRTRRRRVCLRRASVDSDKGGLKSIILIVALAFIFFTRPFQYLRGGWDPGTYVAAASNISRTGSLDAHDPLLSDLSASERKAFYYNKTGQRKALHAGFLVKDAEKGLVQPNFYHLYPAWLAIFNVFFGLTGAYYGQSVIALYALVIFFFAVREIFSRPAADIAVLALALSPAQIYFARFTSAEMLTQFLLFSAFFALARGIKTHDTVYEITGAIALSAAFLAHSTAVLPAAGVFLFLSIYALHSKQRHAWRLLGLVSVCFLIAFARNLTKASIMTGFLLSFIGKHPRLLAPLIAASVAVPAGASIILRLIRKHGVMSREWLARWGPAMLVLLAGIFLYFIRPRFFSSQESYNLQLLGKLISPIALAMCFLFFFLRKWDTLPAHQCLFLTAGGLTCSVLLANKMVCPLYMWAIRRYIPIVIPFCLALSAVPIALYFFSEVKWKKALAGIIMAGILAYLSWQSFPIIKITEYKNLPAFMNRVAAHLEDADLILCDHWKYATPLRYAFGLPAYQLSRQNREEGIKEAASAVKLLTEYVKQEKSVYYVSVDGFFFNPSFFLEPIACEESVSHRLARTRNHLPRTVQFDMERACIYRLRKTNRAFSYPLKPYKLDIGYHSLGLISGFHAEQKYRHGSFRWTDGKAEFYLPCYGKKAATCCTFRLAAKRPEEMTQTVPVNVFANGKKIALFHVAQDWKEYEIILPPDCADANTVVLSLVCRTWNPADYGETGYPANLGIRVDYVKIKPCTNSLSNK